MCVCQEIRWKSLVFLVSQKVSLSYLLRNLLGFSLSIRRLSSFRPNFYRYLLSLALLIFMKFIWFASEMEKSGIFGHVNFSLNFYEY